MNKLNILYEDNHIIVVVKPVNVLSQSDITNDLDMLTMVKNYIKEKYQKPGNVYVGLVHRLDRVVGGIMVFAKTSKAASRLSNSIRKNEIKKRYLAVVHGKVKSKDTLIDYLKKTNEFNTVKSNEKEGKYAELSYSLLDYNKEKNISLVKVNLKTGRHHQIRVQFSLIGHALVGDNRYGNDNEKRIGLYAYQLEIIHPIKKEKMLFTSLPKEEPFINFDLENIEKLSN